MESSEGDRRGGTRKCSDGLNGHCLLEIFHHDRGACLRHCMWPWNWTADGDSFYLRSVDFPVALIQNSGLFKKPTFGKTVPSTGKTM